MKVYVESKYIPEKCSKCKFIGHYEDGIYSRNPHCCCELYWDLHKDEIRVDKNSRDKNCPLKSLTDYTKQVRKEVLASLKEKYKQKMQNALDDFDEELGHTNCDEVLEELLEEIGFNEVLELYQSQKKWYS